MLSTLFIPHGHCYLWKPSLVRLHLISDLLTAISYYSIPITLIYFVRKRQDLPFTSIFILFGAFIVSCGTTHLMEIWTLWYPNYWIAGFLKAITAFVSLYTAIQIWFVMPKALKLSSPEQLRLINKRLQEEIAVRLDTEKKLEEEKMFINTMLDNLTDGIVACNRDGILALFNQASYNFFGTFEPLPPEQWSEHYNLYYSDGKTHLKQHDIPLFRAFSGEAFSNAELVTISKQGIARNLLANGSPIINNKGHKIGAVVAVRDISERKQMQNMLQDSEERFRLAFEDAAIGMVLVAPDGKFLRVNHAFCEIVGYTETELLSLTFENITHPEDLNKDIDLVHQVLKGKIDKYDVEKRYFHNLGHEIWILQNVSLMRNSQQQCQYFIVQIQDITERKNVEMKLNKSLKEKEVMLQEIHHRVKNNLQVICSLLNLQSRYLKEEEIIRSFKDIQNRVRSMAIVHEQLYQSHNFSQISLLEYINQLTNNLFRAYSMSHELEFETQVEEFYLDLDVAVPCGLIINEVVSNAIKYAFKSNSKGKISYQAFANKNRELVLVISDNGIGLPKDFDIEKSKSLGLKLVKNLTSQLQGNFTIDSENNWGTRFEFTLSRIKK